MKSPLMKIAAGAAASIALMAGAAHATTFEFSYKFNTGDTVTGYFYGTGSLAGVTDITNVHVSIDGTPLSGPLYAYMYTAYTGEGGGNCGDSACFSGTGAFASSNPLNNNFVFANGTPTDISSRTNYFYIIPWDNGAGNQVATQGLTTGGVIDNYNGQYIPGNWSLTEVPEPAAWALMLVGFAGLGAAMRAARRRTLATA